MSLRHVVIVAIIIIIIIILLPITDGYDWWPRDVPSALQQMITSLQKELIARKYELDVRKIQAFWLQWDIIFKRLLFF
jgi:hypothetical protein